MDDWDYSDHNIGNNSHFGSKRKIKYDTITMRMKKKAQARPSSFLLWALFVLAAALVIGYLIFKWSEIADWVGSLFLS